MPEVASPPHEPRRETSSRIWPAILLPVVVCCVYWNSLHVPLFFDDTGPILNNPSIQSLWPPWAPLDPPRDGSGVTGRPIVNLSLALNYAIGGENVVPYHATNMALHGLAALALFGVVRRTLLQRPLSPVFGADAQLLAIVIAACWAAHPLQTESVTCVIQRTEILFSLFCLLTFYCFIRASSGRWSIGWRAGAVVSCALGMASKEVMVVVPLLLWIYDRTFIAGTWRDAWRRHGHVHAWLGATLLLLLALVIGMGGTRGDAAGFGLGVPWWAYLLKQCQAVLHYGWLTIWPHPLVLYYPTDVVYDPREVWPQLLVLTGAAACVIAGLRRRSPAAFAGAWFFAILAPSSSIVPLVSQTMAEHRMYLPLVAPIAIGSLLLFRALGRRTAAICGFVLPALALTSAGRNLTYSDEISIWTDNVIKTPENAKARVNLGAALRKAGRNREALVEFNTALELNPREADALLNVAALLLEDHRPEAALALATQAIALRPKSAGAHTIMGHALVEVGQLAQGRRHLDLAVQLDPRSASAHDGLGAALFASGHSAAALDHLKTAIELDPELASAHSNLATAMQDSAPQEAIRHFETAIRLKPSAAEPHNNLANLLRSLGRVDEAIGHYRRAIELWPAYANSHYNLGVLWLQAGRPADALGEFDAVLRLAPDFRELAAVHANRGAALSQLGRVTEAIDALRRATAIAPNDAIARFNLANVLLSANRPHEAIAEYEAAVRLNPGFAEAHLNRGNALLGLRRVVEAIESYQAAVRARPGYRDALDNLDRTRNLVPEPK